MEEATKPSAAPESTPAPQSAPAPVSAPAPAAQPQSDLIDIEQFMKVQFRVAKIEAAEPVEKSKKLLRLQLDVGELGKRQIVSGIAQFYTPESLVGQHIVVVANLKPAKLMGVESHGMLLAASSADGSKLTLVQPSKEIEPGSIVR